MAQASIQGDTPATKDSASPSTKVTYYPKLETGVLGQRVHLIAECPNLNGKTVCFEVFEKTPLLEEEDKALTLLYKEEPQTRIKVRVKDGFAVAQVRLQPGKEVALKLKGATPEQKPQRRTFEVHPRRFLATVVHHCLGKTTAQAHSNLLIPPPVPNFTKFAAMQFRMKKVFASILFLYTALSLAQNLPPAFTAGEWLKYRVHYSFLNASYLTLHLKAKMLDTISVYHAVGRGKTTGFASIFFKVDDTYESYFGRHDGRPYKFIRKINEGGHTKDIEIDFRYTEAIATLKDNKRGTTQNIALHDRMQDLLSASYYFRNQHKLDTLAVGEAITLDMLFDDDGVYTFQLKFLGKDVIRTKFGKVACLTFRPFVQSGRVFKEEESLTLWISDDHNKIPIRIKADLVVGSLKADIDAYNNLKNPFTALRD